MKTRTSTRKHRAGARRSFAAESLANRLALRRLVEAHRRRGGHAEGGER